MNTNKPYITNSTSIIRSVLFSADTLMFGVMGETGTTSTVRVYCGDRGKPVSITPEKADGGYNLSTTVQTLIWTHASNQEIVLRWTEEAEVSDWLQIGLPYGFMAVTLLAIGMIIIAGVALLSRDSKTVLVTVITVIGFMVVLFVFLVVLGAFTTI